MRDGMEITAADILPTDVIRAHSKTNDIPTVTDEQLDVYRSASLEAAESYAGLYLRGQHWIMDNVTYRPTLTRHRLRYPTYDGKVFLRGPNLGNRVESIGPGNRVVELRWTNDKCYTFNDCCDPCNTDGVENIITYLAGYCVPDEVPSGLVLGMLRYVVFCISNPGDIGHGVLNDRAAVGARLISNDAVVASGAASVWAKYRAVV